MHLYMLTGHTQCYATSISRCNLCTLNHQVIFSLRRNLFGISILTKNMFPVHVGWICGEKPVCSARIILLHISGKAIDDTQRLPRISGTNFTARDLRMRST